MEQLQETLHHKDLDCMPSKGMRLYKSNYIKALIHWVSSFILVLPCDMTNADLQQRQMLLLAPTSDVQHHRLDQNVVLMKICEVIHDMSRPSWFGPVPAHDFGNASQG